MTRKENWRNRIVGNGMVDPTLLIPHRRNFRRHPQAQAAPLHGSLKEVGWVAPVTVNKTTGTLIDGHLRVELAIRMGIAEIPVQYVELTEAEELLVLATLDPIGALATHDLQALQALLQDVQTEDDDLRALLEDLALDLEPPVFPEYDESVEDEVEYCECPSCGHRWPK